MGFIVENPVTIAALRKQLKVLDSRVKVFYGTKLKKLSLPDIARDLVSSSLTCLLIFAWKQHSEGANGLRFRDPSIETCADQ